MWTDRDRTNIKDCTPPVTKHKNFYPYNRKDGYYKPFIPLTPTHRHKLRDFVKLRKEDFVLKNGGGLYVHHPLLTNKNAFVLFITYDCPECQDTKTTWSSIAIEAGKLTDKACHKICTQKFPKIMYKMKNGYLADYKGPINKKALRTFLF